MKQEKITKENELSKEDKADLFEILNNSHFYNNSVSIKQCQYENCWYKKIIKVLNIKEKEDNEIHNRN
jgi:hypothetical protein